MSATPWSGWQSGYEAGGLIPPAPPERRMDFVLTFRGFVPGNSGDPATKHRIRQQLHRQLKNLPELAPEQFGSAKHGQMLDGELRDPSARGMTWFYRWDRGEYEFVPLVQRQMEIQCQYDILWIRPVRAGATSGSDLDNCLKNLTDALTVPKKNQMGGVVPPSDDSSRRMYCLLEDDSLVTGFSVKAFRSLEDIPDVSQLPNQNPKEKPLAQIDLILHVRLLPKAPVWGPAGVW